MKLFYKFACASIVWLLALITFGWARHDGASANCLTASRDQIWLISTRGVGPCLGSEAFEINFYDGSQFRSATLSHLSHELREGEPMATVIYAHGYRTDACYAQKRGLEVYRNAIAAVPRPLPIRFVIWSWQTEKESRIPKDFREKSDHSVFEGQRLARFLEEMGLGQGILIGYSMGAQVIVSALSHLSDALAMPTAWNVVLVAPVLAPASCCEVSCTDLDRLVQTFSLLTNRSDRALKGARRLNRLSHRSALDQNSLPSALRLAPGKLSVIDTSHEVGAQHNIGRYSQSWAFRWSIDHAIRNYSAIRPNPVLDATVPIDKLPHD